MFGGDCSAIGAALSATPIRNGMLIEWAVGRGPEGGRLSVFRGDVPARKGCLWHRRDGHRLTPLGVGVNDQDAPWGVITLPAIS